MSNGLTIRSYQEGDEHKILETFNLVFREVSGPSYVDRTMEQWRWAYPDNPAGMRTSVAVADDGTIAAQYAGMLMLFDTPWQEQTLTHCVDSMTHPNWRKGLRAKSLFVETGMHFWDRTLEARDALFYGFPVDVAFRIGKRFFRYEELRVIDYLIRDAALPKLVAPEGIEMTKVDAVPADVDALYGAVRRDKQFLLRRDHRYLTWRYFDIPAHQDYEVWAARRAGQLCGLLVLKPSQALVPDAATIVEFLVPEADVQAADALLSQAVLRQHQEHKQSLLTVLPPWSREYAHLLSRGFVEAPSANWMQRRLIQHICLPQLTPEFLAQNWWYTLGDSDLA